MEDVSFEVITFTICFSLSYLACFIYRILDNRHSPVKTNLFKALLPGTILTLFLFIGWHIKRGWIDGLYCTSFLIIVAYVSSEIKSLKKDVTWRDEKLAENQKEIERLKAENQDLKQSLDVIPPKQ